MWNRWTSGPWRQQPLARAVVGAVVEHEEAVDAQVPGSRPAARAGGRARCARAGRRGSRPAGSGQGMRIEPLDRVGPAVDPRVVGGDPCPPRPARSTAPSCQSRRARRRCTSRCAGSSSASEARIVRAASCRPAAIAVSKAVSLAARWRGWAASSASPWLAAASTWPWRRASCAAAGSARPARAGRSALRAWPAVPRRAGPALSATMARPRWVRGWLGARATAAAAASAASSAEPELGQGAGQPQLGGDVPGCHGEHLLEMVARGREIALACGQLGQRRGAARAPAAMRRRAPGRGRRPRAPSAAASSTRPSSRRCSGCAGSSSTRPRARCSAAATSPSTSRVRTRAATGSARPGSRAPSSARIARASAKRCCAVRAWASPSSAASWPGLASSGVVPAALRLDRVAGVVGDPGELGCRPRILGRAASSAAQPLGFGEPGLGAQGADHAEPAVEMIRGKAEHALPVAAGRDRSVRAPRRGARGRCAARVAVSPASIAAARAASAASGSCARARVPATATSSFAGRGPRRDAPCARRRRHRPSRPWARSREASAARVAVSFAPAERQEHALGLVGPALGQQRLGQPQAWQR